MTSKDCPAAGWSMFITNLSLTNSPILKDIPGLDLRLPATASDEAFLHGMRGAGLSGLRMTVAQAPGSALIFYH